MEQIHLQQQQGHWQDGSSGSGTWGYGLDRGGLEQGQVEGPCDCGNKSSGFIEEGNFWITLEPVSFSTRILFHGVSK